MIRQLCLVGAMVCGMSTFAATGPESRAATGRITQKRTISYPLEQVWPATIRYLRVDRGFAIVDRDRENGFVVFQIPLTDDRVGQGSVEMVRDQDSAGRDAVTLKVSTTGGPTHLAFTLLDGISRKVKDERGQPAPPPAPPEQPPPEDDPTEIPTIPTH